MCSIQSKGLGAGVIDRKCLFTKLAEVTVGTTSFTKLNGFYASTVRTMPVVFF